MLQKIFNSKYPILEACMNRGSTLQLALAVHNAGAYPSLCSWTYIEPNRPVAENMQALKNDIISFVNTTKSNNIHISVDLDEFALDFAPDRFNWESFRKNIGICHSIVKEFAIPTIEIIYGNSNSPRPSFLVRPETNERLLELTQPLHEMGTKIFNRTYDPVDEETRKKYFFDGFCVKGTDSSGFGGTTYSVKELFHLQKQLTPDACVIPYGGIGTSLQVKEYLDLGADIVGVGSLFAFSKDSTVNNSTKNLVISSSKDKLQKFEHVFVVDNKVVRRKQSMLPLKNKQTGHDDFNHTQSLTSGLYGQSGTNQNTRIRNTGHIYIGNAIDHINELLPVSQIVQNLMKDVVDTQSK